MSGAPAPARRFPAGGRVTLTAGGQACTLAGREAALLVELALHAAAVAQIDYGTVAFDLTPGRVALRLVRTFPPVRVGPPADADAPADADRATLAAHVPASVTPEGPAPPD